MLMHSDYRDDDVVCFNFPLLTNNWKTCNCVISSRGIEITPKNTPISKITSFENAARRIFMSATLADDSVFISALGLSEKDVSNIITPEKANDVGDRLILFPKHLDANLDDRCVKQALINAAKRYNVVVIVPSFDRANFWKDAESQVSLQILSSRDNNIVNGIKLLKNGAFSGLTILINKYDGVDLPDDACRYLVIDGLPAMRSEYDIVLQSINPTDKRICCKSIQKIEQGMGRGVRSTNDYCVVVLMGDKLADVIVNQDGERFFARQLANNMVSQNSFGNNSWRNQANHLLMMYLNSQIIRSIETPNGFPLLKELCHVLNTSEQLLSTAWPLQHGRLSIRNALNDMMRHLALLNAKRIQIKHWII